MTNKSVIEEDGLDGVPTRVIDGIGIVYICSVEICYKRTFVEMEDAGKYEWANQKINPDNFSVNGEGNQRRKILLIPSALIIAQSTQQKLEILKAQKFQPGALIEEIMAIGEFFPRIQLYHPIVALRSTYRDPDGGHLLSPILTRCATARILDLTPFDNFWMEPDFIATTELIS